MAIQVLKVVGVELPAAPGVYMIKNITTGKTYVGSSNNIKKRVGQHRSMLIQGKHHSYHLQSSWNKHGPNDFEFLVLEIVQEWSKEIQFSKENFWIKKIGPEYNVAVVAESVLGVKRSNETKARMALSVELRRQKWIRSIYVNITGSLATAVLLEQIVYWHAPDSKGCTKLRVVFQGDYWLAKPREEMMAETGISLKQYQAAIKKLRELKYIDYRIGGFAGKPTPFIRLDAQKLIEDARNTDTDDVGCVGCVPGSMILKEHKPLLPFDPNLCAVLPQTNTTSLTTSLTTKTTLAAPEPKPEEQLPTTEEVMLVKIKPPAKGKVPVKALDVQKACGNKVPTLSDTKASGMYKIWAQTVPKFNPSVPFVKPFTQKQYGQMKQLTTACGSESAGDVLYYVLTNWIRFGKFVKTQAGLKSYPEAPSTDFLAKYSSEAMNFFMTKQEAKDSAINCTEQETYSVPPVSKIGKITLKKKVYVEEVVSLGEAPTPITAGGDEDDDDGVPMTLAELLAFKPLVK